MRHKITKFRQSESGFGVLEALVASGILAVFAAGVVLLGIITIRSTVINKHRLQAAYLAQEAVELVRNIRDSNWIDEDPTSVWNDGIYHSGTNSLKLNKDFDKNWELVSGSEEYTINNVTFTREIRIFLQDIPPPSRKLFFQVEVSWEDYSKERNVTIDTNLTDWMMY